MKVFGIMVLFAILAGVTGSNDFAEELRESKELKRIADFEVIGGCNEK